MRAQKQAASRQPRPQVSEEERLAKQQALTDRLACLSSERHTRRLLEDFQQLAAGDAWAPSSVRPSSARAWISLASMEASAGHDSTLWETAGDGAGMSITTHVLANAVHRVSPRKPGQQQGSGMMRAGSPGPARLGTTAMTSRSTSTTPRSRHPPTWRETLQAQRARAALSTEQAPVDESEAAFLFWSAASDLHPAKAAVKAYAEPFGAAKAFSGYDDPLQKSHEARQAELEAALADAQPTRRAGSKARSAVRPAKSTPAARTPASLDKRPSSVTARPRDAARDGNDPATNAAAEGGGAPGQLSTPKSPSSAAKIAWLKSRISKTDSDGVPSHGRVVVAPPGWIKYVA